MWLILYCWPRVVRLNESTVEIRIPLNRRTRNHLHAMYFGTLCIGADLAGGLLAVMLLQRSTVPISFVFKDVKGEFFKRAEGDVHFVCNDGQLIRDMVARAAQSDERVNETVNITCLVPSKLGDEPVAKLALTLSLKRSATAKG